MGWHETHGWLQRQEPAVVMTASSFPVLSSLTRAAIILITGVYRYKFSVSFFYDHSDNDDYNDDNSNIWCRHQGWEDFCGISCEIVLRWMTQDLTDDNKSTLSSLKRAPGPQL